MKENLPENCLKGFVLFLVVTLLVGGGYWYFKSSFSKAPLLPEKKETVPEIAEPEVSLKFEPLADDFLVKKELEVAVVIDPREKEVWGVDLKLTFDPQYLAVKEASAGGYFAKPLVLENLIDQEKGEIALSIGSLTSGRGKGEIALLVVEPLKKGKTQLGFLSQTQVALKSKEGPAVVEYQDFSLTIPEPD